MRRHASASNRSRRIRSGLATGLSALMTVGLLATVDVQGATAAPSDPWLVDSAQQRLPITVQGEGLSGAVADFPALVTLSAAEVDSADSDSLVFTTDDDATPLAYEVETWSVDGASVWVSVPSVSGTAEDLYMYFDGTPASSVDSATAWDDDFEVVSHMHTGSGTVPDSTGNGFTLEPVAAAVRGAETASGTPGIRLGADEYLDYPGGGDGVGNKVDHITYGGTVYLPEAITASNSAENHIFSREEAPELRPNDQFTFFAHNGRVRPRMQTGGKWSDTPYTALSGPGWYDFQVTYDGQRLKVYVNGEMTQDSAVTGALFKGSILPLRLGRMTNSVYPTKAGQVFDEFRLSTVARSADWIRAEHLARTGELTDNRPIETKDGGVAVALDLTSPADGARLGAEVRLAGTVNQPAQIAYAVDGGQPVELTGHTDAVDLTLPDLTHGEHTLTVTATVAGQTPVTVARTFQVDAQGPQVTVNSPVDGQSYAGAVQLDVDATDAGEAGLVLVLDGTPVRNKRGVALSPGEHVLEVTAKDDLGNESAQTATFTVSGESGREPWRVAEAQQRLPFIIQASDLAEDVEDFPVLVQFDAEEVDHSTITRDSLTFLAAGGTDPLPYEIEKWDTEGVSSVWVRAPSVTNDSSKLFMYFDGAPENAVPATDVWDEEFDVVTHMSNPDASDRLPDSTTNGNLLVERSTTAATFGARTRSGTPGVTFPAGGALTYPGDPGVAAENITITTSVYLSEEHTKASSLENYIVARETNNFPIDDQLTLLLHQGSIGPRLAVDNKWSFGDRVAIQPGWHTISFSHDGEKTKMLIDGKLVYEYAARGPLRTGSKFQLRLGEMAKAATAEPGSYPAKPGYVYDEVRVSKVARSESWQRAEHLALSGRLVSGGMVETSTEAGALALVITSPEPDAVLPVEPTLTGTVSRTASIDYRLDGGDWVSTGLRLGDFRVALGALEGGSHTIDVRATAGADTQASSVGFQVDATKPSIVFTSPTDGANYGDDGVDLDVTANDESGVEFLTLLLDGRPVETGLHLAAEDLVGDDHVLQATAVDRSGNTHTESVSFVAVGTKAPDSWQVPQARRRIPFVVQADIPTPLADVPSLVQFDDRVVDYSAIDPERIVFTTADDPTPLPFEVERWHSSARLSSIWVKVPEVSAEARTIYLYFDGVEPTTVDPTDVWDDDYEFVSHMAHDTHPQYDANGSDLTVEQLGEQSYFRSAGNLSPAVAIQNTPGMKIDSGVAGPGARSPHVMYSATVYVPETALAAGDRHMIMSRGVPGGGASGDTFGIFTVNGGLTASLKLGGSWSSATSPIEAGWHTIATSHDGSLLRLYVDGELVVSNHIGAMLSQGSTEPLMLGSLEDGSQDSLNMLFDQLRVSRSARNASWAKAEHLSATGELVTHGGMETKDSAPALFLSTPAPGVAYAPGLIGVAGTTWEPLTVSFAVDGGAPVEVGVVEGDFGDTIENLAAGIHTLSVTGTRPSGRSVTKSVEFFVDGEGPVIEVETPVEGQRYDEDFRVLASATDANEVASLRLRIDGRTVKNDSTISLLDLTGLDHTLVATATDSVGNVSSRTIAFQAPGGLPAEPSEPRPVDGAVDVDPENAELSVLASDASGEPLDVSFHSSYSGEAASVATGSTLDGVPAPDAGQGGDVAGAAAADDEVIETSIDKAYPFQRFEVSVPADLGAADFEVSWTGSVDKGDRAQLSVWNHSDAKWVKLASAEGDGGEISLQGGTKVAGFVVQDKATVLVQNVPELVMDTDTKQRFLWMTDTQFYSQGSFHQTYRDMAQFAVDNRESEDIVYGVHTGDLVNNPDQPYQWEVADSAHDIMDEADFPYGVLPGNHDVGPADWGDHTYYNQWFGKARFEDREWYGDGNRGNAEHYDVISTPSADYLFLYLGMQLDPQAFRWADDVIKAHPDHNVVIGVHVYLQPYGGADYEYQGRQVFEDLVAPNDNVGMVLTGHNCSPVTRVQRPSEGRVVYEVMFDPQCNPNGGDGWMRWIDFDTETKDMEHSTFSIKKEGNQYWPEGIHGSGGSIDLKENENFVAPYDLQTASRTISTDALTVSARGAQMLGGAPVRVASGERAVLSADALGDLEENRGYSWYAKATNDRGHSTESPVWSFATGEAGQEPELADSTVMPGSLASVLTGQKVTVPVTVTSAGETVPTGSVTVTVGGDAVTGDLDASGRVSIEVGPFATAGTKSLAISYAGDERTRSSSATATVIVTERVVVPDVVVAGTPVVSGTPRLGETLAAAPGTWAPADAEFTYQWLRNGQVIAGATGRSYVPGAADVHAAVSVRVTGSKSGFEPATAESAAVTIAPGTLASEQPTFTGVARVGEALKLRTTDWGVGVTQEIQWLRNGAAIAGATSASYALRAADVRKRISVQVTGTKPGYTTVTRISLAEIVAKGELTARKPTIKGKAKPGKQVKANTGRWKPSSVSYSYQWYVDGRAVKGASKKSYTIRPADAGRRIKVKVTGRLAGYVKESMTSKATKIRRR
ncbi:DUF2341 domain-containing protein [Nocardioides sp. W7]|uniref:DUF2341 domain-containing protein n=1 Tax=Nocardioides sp. W7 TaxID=2931390 RepID=UPI001FD3597D|nr:DUF2341 domain-containing protein [Nocardioides sp. W7]